jgi:F0F1-type ATP synthase membrane subunit b/b'
MDQKNGKIRQLWGREFSVVKHGLDEKEVFTFVGGLIDRNNEYAEKLDHVDSLVKLGENTIIEADLEAERIRAEARQIAEEEARGIVLRAEQDARAEAQSIVAKAEEEAAQQAAQILAEADETAHQKLAAAEQQAQDVIDSAKEQAQQEARTIRDKAKARAMSARQRATRHLEKSRQVAVSDIRAKFDAAYEDMISQWLTEDTSLQAADVSDTDAGGDEPQTDTSSSQDPSPLQPARAGKALRRALFRGKES